MADETIEIEVDLPEGGALAAWPRSSARGPRASSRGAPKYFYDERGSRVFERITEQPEYYPTRSSARSSTPRAAAIVASTRPAGR